MEGIAPTPYRVAPMTFELRAVEPVDFPVYHRAESAGFGDIASQAQIDLERTVAEVDRSFMVVDRVRPTQAIGTCTAFSFELTVPGGATVPVGGASGVTVAVTHRRRGILREMMRRQLDDVAERGEVGAVLMASQASIYGRFGYGVATRHARYEIDTRRPVAFDRPPAERTLRFVERDDAPAVLAPIHDAWRRQIPGAIARSDAWWRITVGPNRNWKGGGALWFVIAEPVPGIDDHGGYVVFELEETDGALTKRLSIRELHAVHPETSAALWKLCLDHDMATSVVAPVVAVDEAVGWRLADPRALRTTAVGDFLWLRLVDVEGALAARRYLADGTLTFVLADQFRPETAGWYRLEVRDGVGSCHRLGSAPSREADLQLDVADLGALYLGGVSVTELARAGRIGLSDPAAGRLADAMFRSERLPFCDTFF